MKRFISLTALVGILLSILGCQQQSPTPQGTAFYFCVTQTDYKTGSTSISAEYRADVPQNSLRHALEMYLGGPLSSDFQSPFPDDLKLVGVSQKGDTVYLTLSRELATLTGLDLTIACGCLTLTTLAITDAQQVEIRTVAGLLDGQRTITMNKDTLLLLDTAAEGE